MASSVIGGLGSAFSSVFKGFHGGLNNTQKAQNLQNLETIRIAIAQAAGDPVKTAALNTELTTLMSEMAAEGQ